MFSIKEQDGPLSFSGLPMKSKMHSISFCLKIIGRTRTRELRYIELSASSKIASRMIWADCLVLKVLAVKHLSIGVWQKKSFGK